MQKRIGLVGHNTQGLLMTIIDYRSYADIDVKFQNGFIKRASYQAFEKGSIYNPMHRSYLNVGFRGLGKYLIKKHDSRSEAWLHMLKRCYDHAYIELYPTYKSFKEMIIRQTALEYRHDIPSKLFDALMNYEVEIDD